MQSLSGSWPIREDLRVNLSAMTSLQRTDLRVMTAIIHSGCMSHTPDHGYKSNGKL